MNNRNLVKTIDTLNISNNILLEISKIQKDMWAFGLGEYVKCNCCNKIHSKNDIFGHLSIEIRNKSVNKLEEIFLGDSISCNVCNSNNTEFIHGIDKNLEVFRQRYKEESFLVLSYNGEGDIIGFCDGYIASCDEVYNKDLSQHYSGIDLEILKKTINEKLENDNIKELLYFSSLGSYQKYSNLNFMYDLLRGFFSGINLGRDIPGITELDENNSLYKIYKILGSISLNLDCKYITNTGDSYKSDICVFPWQIIRYFNDKYNIPLKDLLKLNKSK